MADKDDIKIWLKHAIFLLLLRNNSLWDVQYDFRKCKLALSNFSIDFIAKFLAEISNFIFESIIRVLWHESIFT